MLEETSLPLTSHPLMKTTNQALEEGGREENFYKKYTFLEILDNLQGQLMLRPCPAAILAQI